MPEVENLLEKWEEVYKKGLLSFWMLLVLHRRPAYAFEMNALIQQLSQGTISADDNSLYRALSRFEDMGLVASELQPSPSGPARRYYTLTPAGCQLLRRFIERNVLIFRHEEVEEELKKVTADGDVKRET